MPEVFVSSHRETTNVDRQEEFESFVQREIRIVRQRNKDSKPMRSFSLLLFSRLTEKESNLSGGVIHFTVMDHDLMWSNDFEGEAFLEISKLAGIPHENSSDARPLDELKQFELALTHPKSKTRLEYLGRSLFSLSKIFRVELSKSSSKESTIKSPLNSFVVAEKQKTNKIDIKLHNDSSILFSVS